MAITQNTAKEVSVDTVSPEFLVQRKAMQLSQDLMGGTPAMIAAGTRYIEQGDGESQKQYQARLSRTVLLNTFKRTLYYLKGQVFQKPVVLGADASDAFKAWSEDVDHAGHNLTAWSAAAFEAGLRDGVAFALADYSRVRTRMEGGVLKYFDEGTGEWLTKTADADAMNGWSPYLVHVPAASVIDCWIEPIGGKPVVTMFRYLETTYESDGTEFGRDRVDRIRVLTPGKWVVYTKREGQQDYTVLGGDEGTTTLSVVPLAIFMPGEQKGPATAEPALSDLAELNKRHWAATSGHYELMEYVRRPVWFGRMLGMISDEPGKEEAPTVGAGKLLASNDPSSELKSVGVDASSVAASQGELDGLKSDMAMYGLQLLQPKTGNITATESERDASENNSTLQGWALEFQDFLENCLKFVAMWWGEDDGPSVKVNTDFSRAMADGYLLEMYRAGALSLESYHELLKRVGTLPDDFDTEAEAEKLARGVMVNGAPGGAKSLASMIGGAI